MAFAVTNLCGSKVDLEKYKGTDKASFVLDCLLVAALVTAVCLVVIGKIDLGLGETGTLSNPWMQGFIGGGAGIIIVDAVTALIKKYLPAPKTGKGPVPGGAAGTGAKASSGAVVPTPPGGSTPTVAASGGGATHQGDLFTPKDDAVFSGSDGERRGVLYSEQSLRANMSAQIRVFYTIEMAGSKRCVRLPNEATLILGVPQGGQRESTIQRGHPLYEAFIGKHFEPQAASASHSSPSAAAMGNTLLKPNQVGQIQFGLLQRKEGPHTDCVVIDQSEVLYTILEMTYTVEVRGFEKYVRLPNQATVKTYQRGNLGNADSLQYSTPIVEGHPLYQAFIEKFFEKPLATASSNPYGAGGATAGGSSGGAASHSGVGSASGITPPLGGGATTAGSSHAAPTSTGGAVSVANKQGAHLTPKDASWFEDRWIINPALHGQLRKRTFQQPALPDGTYAIIIMDYEVETVGSQKFVRVVPEGQLVQTTFKKDGTLLDVSSLLKNHPEYKSFMEEHFGQPASAGAAGMSKSAEAAAPSRTGATAVGSGGSAAAPPPSKTVDSMKGTTPVLSNEQMDQLALAGMSEPVKLSANGKAFLTQDNKKPAQIQPGQAIKSVQVAKRDPQKAIIGLMDVIYKVTENSGQLYIQFGKQAIYKTCKGTKEIEVDDSVAPRQITDDFSYYKNFIIFLT